MPPAGEPVVDGARTHVESVRQLWDLPAYLSQDLTHFRTVHPATIPCRRPSVMHTLAMPAHNCRSARAIQSGGFREGITSCTPFCGVSNLIRCSTLKAEVLVAALTTAWTA